MPLYRLDETATVECPECKGRAWTPHRAAPYHERETCDTCHGTGRVPEALDVETKLYMLGSENDGWYTFPTKPGYCITHGPYPTEAEALAAAREAAKQ